jgi:hypothetical protein
MKRQVKKLAGAQKVVLQCKASLIAAGQTRKAMLILVVR